MQEKKLTFMLVPPRGKAVWRFELSRRAFYGAVIGLVLSAGLVVAGLISLLGFGATELENSRLAEENALLKQRLASLEGTIDALTASVERNAEFQRRAQVMANMEDVDDSWRMGIGGPVFVSEDPLARYDTAAAAMALDMEARLEELQRQCEYQDQAFREILKRLEQQKDEWARMPSISPVPDGWTSSGFGKRKDPFTDKTAMHTGLDFSAPAGSPVYATADGVVICAGRLREYGLTVEIDHGNGIVTRYAHNKKLLVKKGQKVERGQQIAMVGRTGRATAPHVHYEVRVKGRPVNPWRYILTAEVVAD